MAHFAPAETISSGARYFRSTIVRDGALALSLLFLTAIIVNPIGEFPLNDDWVYALAVKHLLGTGDFRPIDVTSMPLLSNVIWGALFCVPRGLSFTALRFSTLVASLAGILGCLVLARDLKLSRPIGLLLAFTVALNPIYYALSYTFMTDVPFLAIAIWSAVFFIRALQKDSNQDLFIGTSLALVATLSRQVALCIPLGFALVVLTGQRIERRTVTRAVFPLIVCLSVYLVFHIWLSVTGRMPSFYGGLQSKAVRALLPKMQGSGTQPIDTAYTVLVYLGLFLLPVLLRSRIGFDRFRGRSGKILAVAVFMALATGATIHARYGLWEFSGSEFLMPLGSNILDKSGIGPRMLRDMLILHLPHVRELPTIFWFIVTALGVVGAALLIAELCGKVRRIMAELITRRKFQLHELVSNFLLVSAAIYFAALLVFGLIDRYILPLLFLLAFGLLSSQPEEGEQFVSGARTLRAVSCALVGAFGLFAVMGTHDYMAWNRARWNALGDLADKERISVDHIDGGVEFNAFYGYDPSYPMLKLAFAENPESRPSHWWVRDDTYQISFGPVPGYEIMKEYRYRSWLFLEIQSVFVLRRMN